MAGEVGGKTRHQKADSVRGRESQRRREFAVSSSHSRKSPQVKEDSGLLSIIREKNWKVGFVVVRMKETSSSEQEKNQLMLINRNVNP